MVQSHCKTWGQRSQAEELFQKRWLLPSSFLFEDEDALGWFSQMLMNKWITQDFSFSMSGDGVCDSTFLQAPRWCWWHQSGYHRSYVWHSPSYWGSFSKEQLKLKNLATSSHNTTSFWFRASLSSHRTLGRIHGVSGREHIMGKKIWTVLQSQHNSKNSVLSKSKRRGEREKYIKETGMPSGS